MYSFLICVYVSLIDIEFEVTMRFIKLPMYIAVCHLKFHHVLKVLYLFSPTFYVFKIIFYFLLVCVSLD